MMGAAEDQAQSTPTVAMWRSRRNAGGFLYGAIVTGAVIAVASGVTESAETIALAVAEILTVYWAAHVYTRVLADRLLDPAAGFAARASEALHHELAVLIGGLPGLAVFVVSVLLGASTSTAANLALSATVALLGSAGYAVGRLAGDRGWALVAEIAGASAIGVVIVALKTLGIH